MGAGFLGKLGPTFVVVRRCLTYFWAFGKFFVIPPLFGRGAGVRVGPLGFWGSAPGFCCYCWFWGRFLFSPSLWERAGVRVGPLGIFWLFLGSTPGFFCFPPSPLAGEGRGEGEALKDFCFIAVIGVNDRFSGLCDPETSSG